MYGITINKQNLEKLILDFNTLTGIRIALVNAQGEGIIGWPQELSEFCLILRKDAKANQDCINCDNNAFIEANRTKCLYVYQCHVGLTEALSPIYIDEKIIGYLMFGQVLHLPQTDKVFEKILENCLKYNLDNKELKEALYKLKVMDKNKLTAAANIMEMTTKYILLLGLIKIRYQSITERIKNYIIDNIDKPTTIKDISRELSLSKSYLSRIIKTEFNKSLSEYVLEIKIKKAQTLIEENLLDIKDIAKNLGFSDPNYFSRVFKNSCGVSPSQYRKKG